MPLKPDRLENARRSRVEIMKSALFHRGPDSDGEYSDNRIALGFRRLSIVDIFGGNQPLYNEAKTLVLIANGEIYNYVELAEQLKKQGHVFSTKSDCETIIHLYEEYGADSLSMLRGMFAFAIWNITTDRLFLARDRMGEKPVYFYCKEKEFIFSSELKSLLKVLPVKPDLDSRAVDQFFCHQYIPEPLTAFDGIFKLPAACYLYVSLKEQDLKAKSYWDPMDSAVIEEDPSLCIRKGIDELMPLILRSDVPVGISLSGGIDSGVIAASAASKYKGRLHAFTIGYRGRPSCDERAYAKALSDKLDIVFHEDEISLSDFLKDFPKTVKATDDPVADIAVYGYYRVMRLAHENGIKVVLSGLGGDELFWGYPWVIKSIDRHFAAKKSLASNGLNEDFVFYDLEGGFEDAFQSLPGLYSKSFLGKVSPRDGYTRFRPDHPEENISLKACQLISKIWLISNCIALGDRLSMSNSVEMRLPLLDYKFVETVYGLRKSHSDYNLPPKVWFKEAFKDLLPDDVAGRAKMGFTPPYEDWIKAVLNKYSSLLNNGFLVKNNIFEPEPLNRFIKEAKGNWLKPGSSRMQILAYKIVYFELWCRLILGDEVV